MKRALFFSLTALCCASSVLAQSQAIRAFSHRGGRMERDENTLEAFQESWDGGYTGFETDIRMTTDGVCYIIHDETLERTSNGKGNLEKMTSAEIDVLRTKKGHRILRLEDLVKFFNGKDSLYVEWELKSRVEGLGSQERFEEYVEKYCTDEFKKSMTSDYSKMNLYWTTLKVKIWVYSNTGVFADYYSFDYDLDDPDYVNDAGLLKFYFEMKPDENGDVRTKDGRLYGTGAYLFKTEVKMTSKLRCDLPTSPDEDSSNKKKNAVIKSSDELLKSFGYRRPVNK